MNGVVGTLPKSLPDHTQLPDSDGNFVTNFQEHPQSILLTESIWPILETLHPDGQFCIGQHNCEKSDSQTSATRELEALARS
jgi:hypothetical protein